MAAEQIVAYDQRKVDYATSKGYTVIVVYDDVSDQTNVEHVVKKVGVDNLTELRYNSFGTN